MLGIDQLHYCDGCEWHTGKDDKCEAPENKIEINVNQRFKSKGYKLIKKPDKLNINNKCPYYVMRGARTVYNYEGI